MKHMGREQARGAALGAGFAADLKAGDLASMSTVEAIQYNLASADIDLGKLLKKSFEDQLTASCRFKIVADNEPADAKIKLTVFPLSTKVKGYGDSRSRSFKALYGMHQPGWKHDEGSTLGGARTTEAGSQAIFDSHTQGWIVGRCDHAARVYEFQVAAHRRIVLAAAGVDPVNP